MIATANPDWPEWAERLLDWLHEGKSVLSFCEQPGAPGRRTIYDLRGRNPEFDAQFARAREASADVLVDMAQEVADDARNDWMARPGKGDEDAGWQVNGEHIQRSKLRVDVLTKRAACYDPKRYSTKLAIGGDARMDPIKTDAPTQPIPSNLDLKAGIDRLKALADELLPGDSSP